jgi:4-hydroxybenzoate polyprenyltransferase
MGAWVAIRGEISLPPVLLGAAVLFWVAGFDILYALQDLEFDRQAGLHSIPVKLGVSGSLLLARLFSLVMILLLIGTAITLQLAVPFYCGIAASAALITYEHWLVRDGDLAKLDLAFFTMNGYVSVIIFAATVLEVFLANPRLNN